MPGPRAPGGAYPHGVGNHAVIITEPNDELCEKLRLFLEALHFTGFSNFDIKYDQRDGKFKAFEINTRQGRSNYYVTGAGYNLARILVEDRVEHRPQPLTVTHNRSLWMVVPAGWPTITPPGAITRRCAPSSRRERSPIPCGTARIPP